MNRNTPLRSVWAAADDYCIKAMQCDDKDSSGSKASAINSPRKKSDFNDSEQDIVRSSSVSKPKYVLYETPSNSVPFQNQGLFSVYENKNNTNLEISEDFEAIPEEFRPNTNIKNISKNNYFQGNNSLNYAKKSSNTETNARVNVAQSSVIKETAPKGIAWNENFETDFSEIGQQFNREVQNSKYDSKVDKEQRRGNNVQNDRAQKQSHSEDQRNNKPVSDKKNKESRAWPNSRNPQNKASTETGKNRRCPSVTVLSQITKLHVVTPDREVETSKTIQTSWTTNASPVSAKNKSGNTSKSNEALFEHISRKPERKKMTWMEDLCTVKENDGDNKNTFEYIYRSSGRCSPPEQTKVRQQRKKMNFPVNKSRFNKYKGVPNEEGYSRGTFTDHAEEFIRAQYRYKTERGSQKFERISLPNRQNSKEEVPVVKHVVEVIHVNQPPPWNPPPPIRRRGRGGRGSSVGRGRTRGRGSHANQTNGGMNFAPGCTQQYENNTTSENFDLSWNRIGSEANETRNEGNENGSTIYKFSSSKTTNDKQFTKNKSKINVVEERECGMFSQSKGSKGIGGLSIHSESHTTRFESSSTVVVDSKDIQSKRSLLIQFGKEISDTIVGSYTAMNMFLSFYKEWINLRVNAMQLLENIAGNISKASNQRNKTKDVLELFGNGGRMIAAIPNVQAAIAGRIVAALSDFFAKLFSSSPTLKQSGMNEFELMLCLQQDIDATSDMNIFGIQCDQNFQEACQLIEEFHNNIQGWYFKDIVEGVDVDFLEDISAMNPKHHIVYYRRLQKWLESLAENPSTDISRAFTRGFKDFPDALKITNLLHWRFHIQGIDETERSWEEIRELLQYGDSIAVVDVLKKIQNSLLVLIKERSAMERDVMELLNTEKEM